MISDTLELQEDGIEEEADEEVNKVIAEITSGLLGQAGAVGAELVNNLYFGIQIRDTKAISYSLKKKRSRLRNRRTMRWKIDSRL